MLSLFHDTIVAASTPRGTAALAIVRLTGVDAIRIAAQILSNPESLYVLRGGSAVHTNILDTGGAILDDVVLTVFRAPNSFSGEDMVEISSHGSPVISDLIVELLVERGARHAEAGEFSRRAFLNGKIQFEEVEALVDRMSAESPSALRGAERAVREKFARLRAIYERLIGVVALVDAAIDFGDSDNIEVENLNEGIASCLEMLDTAIRQARTRRANLGAITIALVGPPNVGKSSLFNVLLEIERSIVSDVPGTTRDYLEAFMTVGGARVKVVDTAGLRQTDGAIEQHGIALGRKASLEADLIFQITDPDHRLGPFETGAIPIHNKVDIDRWTEGVCVSARTGVGIIPFRNFIANEVEKVSDENSRIRVSSEELASLVETRELLSSIEHSDLALIAENLRLSIRTIGELLGVNVGEDSLNHIFSKMCIGK